MNPRMWEGKANRTPYPNHLREFHMRKRVPLFQLQKSLMNTTRLDRRPNHVLLDSQPSHALPSMTRPKPEQTKLREGLLFGLLLICFSQSKPSRIQRCCLFTQYRTYMVFGVHIISTLNQLGNFTHCTLPDQSGFALLYYMQRIDGIGDARRYC